jgi:hypothetical protein
VKLKRRARPVVTAHLEVAFAAAMATAVALWFKDL